MAKSGSIWMKAIEQRLEVTKLKGLEAARSTAGAREALDPQQKLVVARLAGRNLDGLNPRGESETEWWVWLPRPNSSLRACSAFWRRCSGPIGEASSGEIRVNDVLGLGGSVVEWL